MKRKIKSVGRLSVQADSWPMLGWRSWDFLMRWRGSMLYRVTLTAPQLGKKSMRVGVTSNVNWDSLRRPTYYFSEESRFPPGGPRSAWERYADYGGVLNYEEWIHRLGHLVPGILRQFSETATSKET